MSLDRKASLLYLVAVITWYQSYSRYGHWIGSVLSGIWIQLLGAIYSMLKRRVSLIVGGSHCGTIIVYLSLDRKGSRWYLVVVTWNHLYCTGHWIGRAPSYICGSHLVGFILHLVLCILWKVLFHMCGCHLVWFILHWPLNKKGSLWYLVTVTWSGLYCTGHWIRRVLSDIWWQSLGPIYIAW